MRKMMHFFVLFSILCIFLKINGNECSAKNLYKQKFDVSVQNSVDIKQNDAQLEDIGSGINIEETKIISSAVKEYKKTVILPEFKNVTIKLKFRAQSPRMNTDEEVNQNICSILY